LISALISALISGVSRRLLVELGVIEIEELLPMAQQRDHRHIAAAEFGRELLDLRHNNKSSSTTTQRFGRELLDLRHNNKSSSTTTQRLQPRATARSPQQHNGRARRDRTRA